MQKRRKEEQKMTYAVFGGHACVSCRARQSREPVGLLTYLFDIFCITTGRQYFPANEQHGYCIQSLFTILIIKYFFVSYRKSIFGPGPF